MVESLSSHKIIQAARDADEADVVACIAAVTAYMKLEEEELAAAAAKKGPRETRSPWGQAALLEGAQVGAGFIVTPSQLTNSAGATSSQSGTSSAGSQSGTSSAGSQ